ncbi:hypothetical protein JXA47_12745 [Candidatus Sumerlaeota bacterium]|nr:hypothetical protein [Candidatus Sumerlaeota bacterium]
MGILRSCPLGLAAFALAACVACTTAQPSPDEVIASVGRLEALQGDTDRFAGLVVAAPHADYDRHTGEIVTWIHEGTDLPCLLAWGFRRPPDLIWYDVNRPTERAVASGELSYERIRSPEAEALYAQWQAMVFDLADCDAGPIDLYVDIHGHTARYETPEGEQRPLEVIETVAMGFTDEQVERIRDEYERLAGVHGLEDPAPMVFLQTDPYYDFEGVEQNFLWEATGARTIGALRPECARRALHFENPETMRSPRERRRRVASIYADLILFIWQEILESAPPG